ncbi:MAG: aquaporin [Chloroflexota bacterium]
MNVKELTVEFIGTFTLCFVGIASVIVVPLFGIVAPAFAHGLVVIGMIYSYGHISGAHINPAVTFGLLIGGQISLSKSIFYMIAQFLGGICAAYILTFLVGGTEGTALLAWLGDNPFNHGQTVGFLTENNVWRAAAVEGILIFLLLSVIYQSAVYNGAGNLAGLAIGLTLAALIFSTGAFSGASINPARTLGPVLTSGDYSYVVPYFIGLFSGGAVAGLFNGYLLKPDEA